MQTKNKVLITILLLLLFTTLNASGNADNNNIDDGNLLLLKAGHINTDNVTGPLERTSKSQTMFLETSSAKDEEKYYIVQFTGPVHNEWKQNVTSKGASIYNYVPNNAFVFKMNEDVKDQVQVLSHVKWIGEYSPSYKYDPALTESGNIQISGSQPENTSRTYNILLFSASYNEMVEHGIKAMGASVLSVSGNILKIQSTPEKLHQIASMNEVRWIEEYSQVSINNDIAADIISVSTVHETYGLKGKNQIVAVCDSGLDTGNKSTIHADLRGRLLNITDVANDGSVADQNGHGTHVAGSVLGNGSLSGGQYAGMAPEAELVFQAVGNGSDYLSLPENLSQIFQPAYDIGARIHTNSWGSSEYGIYTKYAQQVDHFMWENPDILILFSAGNGGPANMTIGSPGTAKNALTVGASENYRPEKGVLADDISHIADFSSRGPTEDGRIKPDLVAPGTFIYSTRSSLASGTGNYTYMSGTSMSTPITAGSAAIVRQYYQEIENSSPSAALLKATLINGALDLSSGQHGTVDAQEINGRPDYSQGWGRIDIKNSIYPQYPNVIRYFDNPKALNLSDSWNVSCEIGNGSEKLRATLVWTDYPGDVAVDMALVNNLDLITIAPDATIYYGNYAPDILNNVEGIELSKPCAGTYKFVVNGTNVPHGPQNFSLVLYFRYDVNEFPQNSTYTNNNKTVVSMNLKHSHGINSSSINMTIGGSQVIHSLEEIDSGYKIENQTFLPYSEGEHNISVTALTNKDHQLSYSWIFSTDYTPPVISNVTNSSSSSSVTLSWEASADNDHLEIWRNGNILGNYYGSQMNDTGLSASTLYNYSLRAVDLAGNIGNWSNITVITPKQLTITSTPSSSSGGGGGGSTGEAAENIAFKDVLSTYISADEMANFEFNSEKNDIEYIRYQSLKNSERISTTIEILKNTSSFTDSPAPGMIYRNINIWVGKAGYATEENIRDPVIGFRVSKEWILRNDIDPAGISLKRYSHGKWKKLDTKQTLTDEKYLADDKYLYFEAETPGFSPFVITADEKFIKQTEEENATISTELTEPASEEDTIDICIDCDDDMEDVVAGRIPAISGFIAVLILMIVFVIVRKQQN